jgi:hypothetical protein
MSRELGNALLQLAMEDLEKNGLSQEAVDFLSIIYVWPAIGLFAILAIPLSMVVWDYLKWLRRHTWSGRGSKSPE